MRRRNRSNKRPALWSRETSPESTSNFSLYLGFSAILQVRSCELSFCGSLQLLHEKSLRLAVHFHENRALLVFFPLLWRALFLPRNSDPAFLRDNFHGLGKLALLHVHHEVVNVAALAAPEAIENLFDRRNGERRCLFLVKRAQSAEVFACFLQAHIFANNANDVGLLFHFIRK